MASSSLSDFSTCAERTLNVTGPQRTALIRLWEQRAMGREGGLQERASFNAGFFTRPCIYSLTSMWCHKDTSSFSVHCTAPHASTHTQHRTQPAGGPDQAAQLVYPSVDSPVGDNCRRDLPYLWKQCRDSLSLSRSSFISPQGTNTNLFNK